MSKTESGLQRRLLCLAASCLLGVGGCSTSYLDINSELAEQIAVDAAGIEKSKIQDLSSSENSDGSYTVTFTNEKGAFSIEVSSDGGVKNYLFTPSSSAASDKPDASEAPETSDDSKEDQDNSADPVLPEGSLSKEELLKKAATLVGMKEEDAGKFVIESVNETSVKILGINSETGMNYEITMNPKSGSGTYVYFQNAE